MAFNFGATGGFTGFGATGGFGTTGTASGFGGFTGFGSFGTPAKVSTKVSQEIYTFDEEEYANVRERILSIIHKYFPQVDEYQIESLIRTLYDIRSRNNFEIEQREQKDKAEN